MTAKSPFHEGAQRVQERLGVRERSEPWARKMGDEFAVFSLGEEFVGHYTDESLGHDEEKVGVVRVTQVKRKNSKANPVGGLGAVKAGDLVRALGR